MTNLLINWLIVTFAKETKIQRFVSKIFAILLYICHFCTKFRQLKIQHIANIQKFKYLALTFLVKICHIGSWKVEAMCMT